MTPWALIPRLPIVVLTVAVISSLLFVAQGGFGGGHGPFDLVIFLLGVPWTLILLLLPWAEALWVSDYVMLVLVPLGLNLLVLLAAWGILVRRRRHLGSSS